MVDAGSPGADPPAVDPLTPRAAHPGRTPGPPNSLRSLHLSPRDPAGWWIRAAALTWCARILIGTLGSRDYRSLWSGLTLGIHELGHILLGPLGMGPGVAGGSLAQLAAPTLAAILLRRQRDPVGAAVALVWLGTSFVEMGSYIGDARARDLVLVSPFAGEPIHDWGWMLGRAGLLEQDRLLGELSHFTGVVLMGGALLLGGNALLGTRPGKAAVRGDEETASR